MCVKKNLFGIAKSVSFVVALTTGLTTVSAVFAPVVMAAEKGQQLSSKMKPLGEADKLMKEKKYKEALAIINEKVVPIPGKTPYEETVTNEMKAACLAQLKDYAGVAKVYETMLGLNNKSTYEYWTAEFNPTSTYEGNWEKGSKILFVGVDENGKKGGMVSEIEEHKPASFISIRKAVNSSASLFLAPSPG